MYFNNDIQEFSRELLFEAKVQQAVNDRLSIKEKVLRINRQQYNMLSKAKKIAEEKASKVYDKELTAANKYIDSRERLKFINTAEKNLKAENLRIFNTYDKALTRLELIAKKLEMEIQSLKNPSKKLLKRAYLAFKKIPYKKTAAAITAAGIATGAGITYARYKKLEKERLKKLNK